MWVSLETAWVLSCGASALAAWGSQGRFVPPRSQGCPRCETCRQEESLGAVGLGWWERRCLTGGCWSHFPVATPRSVRGGVCAAACGGDPGAAPWPVPEPPAAGQQGAEPAPECPRELVFEEPGPRTCWVGKQQQGWGLEFPRQACLLVLLRECFALPFPRRGNGSPGQV